MNILILNWRDIKHPLAGGAEIVSHEHAKAWVKDGHSVIQFSSSNGEKEEEIIDGVRIIRRGNHYTVHLHAFFYYIQHLRNKTDLVVDEFHFIPFFTPLYVRKKKLAFIHEVAKNVWFKNLYFPINVIGYLLEPFFFKLYRNISFMTVSGSAKKDLEKFGIRSSKIRVIYSGVNVIMSKSKKQKNPTIIYLGRLAEDKGTEDAIKAFFKIQGAKKDTTLWVVGREEKKGYKDRLRNVVKQGRIEKNVIFFDYVKESKKFDLLKKAWILIHPSVREGWGLTVIEAASQGTPTVGYNVPGLCDSILDKKTGLLVPEKNPKGLSQAVLVLLDSQTLYENLCKNSVAWSRKFNWKNATSESLRFIKEIT